MHPLVVLVFLLPCATFPAVAAGDGGGGCNRRCNATIVPYPFGFSGDCPILLMCNASISSMPLLPHSTAAAPYPILSFNSISSTFLANVTPSCNRSVAEARSSLDGAGYGVTSRTALFLRVACRTLSLRYSNCSVPADRMTRLLRTAQCRGAGGNDTSWTCVVLNPLMPLWEMVNKSGCEDALTAAVHWDTQQDVPSIQFGVAELWWWLNGTCDDTGGGRCVGNATCTM